MIIRFIFLFIFIFPTVSFAVIQEPRGISSNVNIKEMIFNQDAVHNYTGFYGYQSSIVFAYGEEIVTVSIGNSNGWQITPQSNRLFIKPMQDATVTNATLITNLRVYHFIFSPDEASSVDDPRLSYEVRFRYPENRFDNNDYMDNSLLDSDVKNDDIILNPDNNYNYTVYGSDRIKPSKVFDDGLFTYMLFDESYVEIPAVFYVEKNGYESMVNFRFLGDYMIVERIGANFTLRNGDNVVCVTNNNYYPNKKTTQKKSLFSKR